MLIAKEQPKPLAAELGTEPVLPVRPEGCALAVFAAPGIGRNGLGDKLVQRRQKLGTGRGTETFGVFFHGALDCRRQSLELIEKQRMAEYVPTIDDQHD